MDVVGARNELSKSFDGPLTRSSVIRLLVVGRQQGSYGYLRNGRVRRWGGCGFWERQVRTYVLDVAFEDS